MFWKAIEDNNWEGLVVILKKENIDTSIQDDFGYSPLHIAISKECSEAAKVLIENRFEVNTKDPKGQTPLHYCAFYNNITIAELLLNNGAKLNIADDYGNEPLWTAVFNDKGAGRRIEIIHLFMKFNADKNHKNLVGKSPLDITIIAGYKNLQEILNG